MLRMSVFPLMISLALISASAHAEPDIYSRALELIEERYLRWDEVVPSRALELAAEAAEDAIPWLIVDTWGGEIVLQHGESGEFARLATSASSTADILDGLRQLEQAIASGPEAIPADVDIEVELLSGLMRELDRHSVIMHRGRLQRFDERIKGRLTGVGSRINSADGELVVKEIFPDSPAERGGLQLGDVIVQIDGFSTMGLSASQAVRRIRGPEGSTVQLSVRRDVAGQPAVRDLDFTREVVRIPNVTWERLASGVGIIRIENFSEQTVHWMRQALLEFEEAGPLAGLIIDLRGNTGGSMIQACRSVDLFLTEGTVLRTDGRDGQEVRSLLRRYPARLDGDEPEVPVVLLVNSRSASASEILAGALMLQDRAVLIGTRTHGKGTVQMRHTLRGGDEQSRVEMKLTVAEYKLGDEGMPIVKGRGLEPDLWTLPAVFTQGGVSVPDAVASDHTAPVLVYVDEQKGWRASGAPERGDYLEKVAEQVLLSSAGWSRAEVLAAMDGMLSSLAMTEQSLMAETFALRGLDWSAAGAPGQIPQLDVEISVVDPPVAGEKVEVRALVVNRGTQPLHQLRIQLSTDASSLPWNDLTLPIGLLPPGESGLGSAMVTLPAASPSRIDPVFVDVYADGIDPLMREPVLLRIEARPRPSLAAVVALEAGADGDSALHLTLENRSSVDLVGVRARLALPDDAELELLEREVELASLMGGAAGQVALHLRLPELVGEELEMELRVDAESLGEILRVPIAVRADGQPVRIQPPEIFADLPTEAPAGQVDVSIDAVDDTRLSALSVWWDSEQIAWRRGEGAVLDALLPVVVDHQHHVLTIEAIDEQGARTVRTFHVQGDAAAAAADAQAP